ncbi:hypothetical protein DX933_05620 [Ornithinibacillus gellani]|uniref:VanW family protein n=1 Tax=Ornithinibacillus gellani TaxID=2293253 RepID=UPI000F487919|nr:VanW family protein [Ornithinibacillus gellani]TQS75753.1 hypothetical protein DX933_05620 [Ornithinibacillus gellani]
MRRMIFLLLLSLILPVSIAQAKPLILKYDDKSETIMYQHFSLPYVDPIFMDMKKWQELINHLGTIVYEKPKNAYLDENGKIVEAVPGKQVDRHALSLLLLSYYYEGKTTADSIPVKPIYPAVDSELLSEISVKQLNAFVTYYRESNQERSHNIDLAAKAINNHVVFPGETFSFNKVVGERTKQRGYKRAPVIVKGELSEDIGGGICQVSSTLFNAVNLVGIQIMERYSHSRSVPYVPSGKDAAVSWWGPDFVFKNTYHMPILIRSKAIKGKMIIQILSSDAIENTES